MTDEKWELVTCDDGRLIVATAGDVVCHTDPNHAPGDEWDAKNFRKIAALPDLLAALKIAEKHIDHVCGETSEADLPDWFADLVTIRSAIAKAEGRACPSS